MGSTCSTAAATDEGTTHHIAAMIPEAQHHAGCNPSHTWFTTATSHDTNNRSNIQHDVKAQREGMILSSSQNMFGGSHNPLQPRTTTTSSSSPSSALARKHASASTALHMARGTSSSSGDASSSFARTTTVCECNNSAGSGSCALAPPNRQSTSANGMTKTPSFRGERPPAELWLHGFSSFNYRKERHRCGPPPPHNAMRRHSGAKGRSSTCHPPPLSPQPRLGSISGCRLFTSSFTSAGMLPQQEGLRHLKSMAKESHSLPPDPSWEAHEATLCSECHSDAEHDGTNDVATTTHGVVFAFNLPQFRSNHQ
ncbi:Hypothetical protein, putative [Bodo saltans]|uniref:Uncharacterized protein n=1 Tax=Bodo saltans TaxID=75058 RepID=A0A0S4J060_BODSA|nr:Hypothetical protein, putative [Bodo saltans]|eukprot:CUG74419.1 Hypothetical protein, putative [Bodo saltans]